jgi:hypothetical protein
MKKDDNLLSSSPPRERSLPADFAERVLAIAHKKLERRRRKRIVAVAALVSVMAAIPLLGLMRSRLEGLGTSDPPGLASERWPPSSDDALAYQVAQTVSPRSAGDYLLPNANALAEFSSTYSEASWQYDSQWTYSR